MAIVSNISSRNHEAENIQLFQNDIVIHVIYMFIRDSMPSPAHSEPCFKIAEGTIISTARFDAYVATIITCLRVDESKNVGTHRHRPYKNIFSFFFSVVFA